MNLPATTDNEVLYGEILLPGEGEEIIWKDPDYLALVAELPCCICEAFGERQMSRTQVHHVFHGRFSQRKTPDRMAIPLCEGHHLAQMDTSKLAIHRAKESWRLKYGDDFSYSAATQDKLL
jgi:hypothetical protein